MGRGRKGGREERKKRGREGWREGGREAKKATISF